MGTMVNYENGSFVVIRAVEDESVTSIRIGKVPHTILDESDSVS